MPRHHHHKRDPSSAITNLLFIRPSEWQICKECMTRNVLLSSSIALSIVGFFLLIFSTGAISSTEIADVAFNLAEQSAARHSGQIVENNQLQAVTLEVLPTKFQPTTLLAVGLKFLLPPIFLSIVAGFRHLFYPYCHSSDSDLNEYRFDDPIRHDTWWLGLFLFFSVVSLFWSIFGIVVFVRFVKQFNLKECVQNGKS